MPEQIISASGTQFGLIINPDGSLNASITGSIMIGSVSASVDSIYVQSGTMYLSSGNVTMASSAGSVGVYGSVFATGSIVTAGSTTLYGVGSVRIAEQGVALQVFNSGLFSVVGSINQSSTPWTVTGSVASYGIGSNLVTNWPGSTIVYGSIYSTGSVNISAPVSLVGSVGTYGSIFATGSVNISTPVLLTGSVGVYGSVYSTGSMEITNDKLQVYTSGIVSISGIVGVEFSNDYVNVIQSGNAWLVGGSVYATGSMNIATSLPSIGSFTSMTLGSVAITNAGSVIQLTSPWVVLGSMAMTNAGSVVQSTSPWIVLGSVALTNTGSAIVTNTVAVSGAMGQGTSPWVTSGTATVAGSVYAVGSINIATNPVPIAGSVRLTGQDVNIQVYNSGAFSIVGSLTSCPMGTGVGSVLVISSAGSVGTYGSEYITGSINQGTDPWRITGSITSYGIGSVLITNLPGSTIVYGSVYAIGSIIVLSSAGSQATFGSVYTIGSINVNNLGSESWIKNVVGVTPSGTFAVLGSQYISNASDMGSIAVQTVQGSVYQLTVPWEVSGTVNTGLYAGSQSWIFGSAYVTGSVNLATAAASIGSFTSMALGSVAITNIGSVIQSTSPWVVSGTATVAGSVYATGSVNIATSLQSIGSFTSMVLGSVAITNIGSVIQSTSPWVVSGTSTISGSAYVTGSVNIASIPSFIGSVNVTNFAQIGSLATQSVSGSIYVTGSMNILSTAGSIGVYNSAFEDFTLRYTTTIAYTGLSIGSVVEYIGLAAPGTSKTGFTWQIRRNTYASDGNLTDIGFADGNANLDNSWADRGTGTYT